MKLAKYIIIAVAAVICAFVIARAYTYKYRAQDTIVVTGLGEAEFTSDLIVWNATITVDTQNIGGGYSEIKKAKEQVAAFIHKMGVPDQSVVFQFVNVNKTFDPVYNGEGNYAGQRFTGYAISQPFTVESKDVKLVEKVSREISSLIEQGITIEAGAPEYYYTKLDDVKLGLIEKASADARVRAEKIAKNAGTKIGRVASANMGVFQITGANSDEDYEAGGSFNTSSFNKKARITMRIEYRVK